MIRSRIEDALASALDRCGASGAAVQLEHPADLAHGDYASSAALQYAKQLSLSPRALAEKLVESMGSIDGVSHVEIAGPGFINFRISPQELGQSLQKAIDSDMWGSHALLAGKKVMVEYTDPNPFKEFHIGHLMSNSIGESIARLHQFAGATVLRANYQGDVGPHVAKAIWGIRTLGLDASSAASLGRAYAAGAKAYEEDERAKQEIEEINKKVYDHSDSEIDSMYAAGREASLRHFEELYHVLGTKFDHYFFESVTAPRGVALIQAHPEIFEVSEGARVFKGEQYGLHTRVFLTSRGLPTYEAKELGLAEMKNEQEPSLDTSIYVTAHEQADYFKVVKKAIEILMPAYGEKIVHVSHGMMRFAEGKMSSRSGNVVTGESLLNDLIEVAKKRAAESRADNTEELARAVAVAAIKYQILKQGSAKDIVFDRERALSVEGDSGPYLQYAHARAHQITTKAKTDGVEAKIDSTAALPDAARLVHRFPEIAERACALYEPHVVTNYLIELASSFNSWYASEQILDGTSAAAHKVAITDAVRRTLKNGLWVIGIAAPEKM